MEEDAYLEKSIKRNHQPAVATASVSSSSKARGVTTTTTSAAAQSRKALPKSNTKIVQVDGHEDNNPPTDYDGLDFELVEENEEEGATLGPEDDDDEDDGTAQDPYTEDLVLCQFEKVTRIKNKWKCNLKDGIMHINGQDYLFGKATGEFEW